MPRYGPETIHIGFDDVRPPTMVKRQEGVPPSTGGPCSAKRHAAARRRAQHPNPHAARVRSEGYCLRAAPQHSTARLQRDLSGVQAEVKLAAARGTACGG